jgi:hypothetical protein
MCVRGRPVRVSCPILRLAAPPGRGAGGRAAAPVLPAAAAIRRPGFGRALPPAGRGRRNAPIRGGKQWSGEKTR